ncbi:MAG: hypothetical protein HDR27_00415 [Lachnospiraceae bacterium]|nr:hypothetical protein [Lachnospiraceae bacterium]
MKPGRLLFAMIISCVLLWGSIFCFIGCSGGKAEQAKLLAEKALYATVENPESIEIKAFSEVDSVFGREYVTPEEKMNLALAMLKVNRKVMEETGNLEDVDTPSKEVTSLMERQMSAVSALRAVSPFSTDGPSDEKKEFSGWKVKVEYTAKSSQGVPYHSEFWCIIDKEAEVVINSFEIPIL